MPSWTTPIAAGTNVQDGDLISMLIGEYNKRLKIDAGDAPAESILLTAPSQGDDIQRVDFWIGGADPGQPARGLFSFNPYLISSGSTWIDDAYVLEGSTELTLGEGGFAFMTFAQARVKAGLPTVYVYPYYTLAIDPVTGLYAPATGAATEDESLRNTQFRRRRPREIYSTTATYDVNGNEAQAGQVAYLVGVGLIPERAPGIASQQDPPSPLAGNGTIWRCVAPGSWEPATGAVDVLDNTQQTPNTVAYITDQVGEASNVWYGDYYGAYLLEEQRRIMDVLRAQVRIVVSPGPSEPFYVRVADGVAINSQASAGADASGLPSVAAVTAAIAGSWAVADGATLFSPGAYSFLENYDGTEYSGNAERASATLAVTVNSAAPCLLDYYLWADAGEYGEPSFPGMVFDANGDGVVQGQWHSFGRTSVQSGGVNLSDPIGDPSSPPNTPADPGSGNVAVSGWVLVGAIAFMRWNVAGGLACSVVESP